jgi:hypothetical protein
MWSFPTEMSIPTFSVTIHWGMLRNAQFAGAAGGRAAGGHRYAAAADDSELCERRVPAAGHTYGTPPGSIALFC